MLLPSFFLQKHKSSRAAQLVLLLVLIALSLFLFRSTTDRYFSPIHAGSLDPWQSPSGTDHDGSLPLPLPLPGDYSGSTSPQPGFCRDRFSTKYLEDLRARESHYCSRDSISRLTCFHAQVADNNMVDTLCIGSGVVYNSTAQKFGLDCPLREEEVDTNETAIQVPFSSIRSYWYDTGAKHIFDNFVSLDRNGSHDPDVPDVKDTVRSGLSRATNPPAGRNFTVLVKREGEGNLWHCLMEIMTMTYTFDVLRMARDPATGGPFFRYPEDVENTQVVVLDDHGEGPYWDLWQLFSGQPPKKLRDLVAAESDQDPTESWLSRRLDNIIIPLAGNANPIWQNDWTVRDCTDHELLRTFTRRVLVRNGIPLQDDKGTREVQVQDAEIKVTVIDRKGTRQLHYIERLLDALRERIPASVRVQIQAVDMAALSFQAQLRIVRETDVLVGVHGAGLTHLIFMREGRGAVVEIQPQEMSYKGFRNLALMLGQEYFVAHAEMVDPSSSRKERRDGLQERARWHSTDVEIDQDKFVDLVEVAIKSVYNKGLRNYEAV